MGNGTAAKKHSRYSASGAYRWIACPGSVALCDLAPPSRDSKYAAEGTRAHECLEYLLKERGTPKTAIALARMKYGPEMTAHAHAAVEAIASWTTPGATVYAERKVALSHIEPDMFGTLDCAIAEDFGRLTVIDYKYGAGIPVDPKDNPQLIFYALALAHEFDLNFDYVCLTVIQPRAHHEEGPIRQWALTLPELLKWDEIFKAAVAATKKPGAPLKAGDHCRFCPAAAECPALESTALTAAKHEFGTPPVDPKTLPADRVAEVLRAAPVIETWLAAVHARAVDMLESGQAVPGFKLVEKRGIRKWTDPVAVAKAASAKWSMKAFSLDLLSPAQLEKVAGKEWVNARAASVSSGVTLASESDKRPAVTSALLDFKPGNPGLNAETSGGDLPGKNVKKEKTTWPKKCRLKKRK